MYIIYAIIYQMMNLTDTKDSIDTYTMVHLCYHLSDCCITVIVD